MDDLTATFPRFWAKVDGVGSDGCWTWAASKNWAGYGRFRLGDRTLRAHRVAYELVVGPIPDGLQLDHLCRNPACVNPAHLEPVTASVNTKRGLHGVPGTNANARKTHCPQGHPYDDANVYAARGRRECRICARERQRASRARRAAGVVS